MPEKRKFEMNLTKEQSSEFLRKVADSIEQKSEIIEDYGIDLKNYGKLKLSIKPKFDQMKLKVSLKKYFEEEEDEEYKEIKGREEYKYFKKRMKSYFQEIKESLDQNVFPSSEIVSVFLKDSETMRTYQVADEYYQDYMEACSKLSEAYQQEDFKQLQEQFNNLNEIKDACHLKYK